MAPPPMALLSSGVPLSLLLDLALGPDSEDLMRHERGVGAANLEARELPSY